MVDQIRGVTRPFIATLAMAAAVIQTRLYLPADWGPLLRLMVLVPLGAIVFAGAISLLDRRLVKEFLEFGRAAFEQRRKSSAPQQQFYQRDLE